MNSRLAVLVAAIVTATPVSAQQPSAGGATVTATAPGRGEIASVVVASAEVVAIDKANRVVTLLGPRGNRFRIVAGPEVRNFDQIKVGDEVVVRHYEAVSLELKKGGAGIRERDEGAAATRAPKGDRPGVAVAEQVTVVADVVAVNRRSQTVTLRGPEHTVDLHVRDPEQFKRVQVGDQVQATFTEAIAISVEPAK
ncbi:MAG: hypothetical protein R3357_08150 [Burkholderiales bacterium]|nr:hypothetical protein [Burkholderiales bacterium]